MFPQERQIFSEISAILAPSQNTEKANAIAGLWPRITPRSLLRQLAQDRIGTLPDQWKVAIRTLCCLLPQISAVSTHVGALFEPKA
jgi:hypothetical protein